MKNARVSARRVLQGGAAFAALGALGLATAMPAYADTYGWGYASAVGGEGASETYVTQDQTISNSFSSGIGGWLTVDGTTTATVNADGASATTVIDTARILITLDDLEDILDPEEDAEEEKTEEDDSENDDTDETDGPDDTDLGNGGDDGNDDGASQDPGGPPSESVEPGEDTVTPAPDTDPEPSPTPEPSEAPETDADGAANTADENVDNASDDVIELNEENSELVDGGDTVVIEATVSGATVSTSQSWGGDVSHDAFEGTVSLPDEVSALSNGEEVTVEVLPVVDQGVVQTEDAGFLWNDAYTNLYLAFSVDGEIVNGYTIAESAAGITTGAADGGGDTGGGEEGDDKTPPKERDEDTLPKTDVEDAKDAEPLATTGSPVIGLIAAGAAIAAGGGAAAYLARRKKNGNEVDEAANSES